ncbi:MAG: acyltransferase [Bacteroidales bacterium]|nr:acyltransferase [Bacteroidales bacterium]
MLKSDKEKNLQEVTLIRAFAIITLVAWHCYCSYICWGIADTPFNGLYSKVFRVIAPIAQMPLFTFLAGYLFCYLHKYCNKYSDFKLFIKNKARRLLIPYIVLGFIINMTQLTRQHPIDLFWGTPNHLWYCLMLFYCFIINWIVENKIGRWLNYVLASVSFAAAIYYGGQFLDKSPLGILIPVFYYCYFFLGYYVYENKDRIMVLLLKWLPLVIVLWLLSLIFTVRGHAQVITSVLFILMVLFFAQKIQSIPSCIETIAKYSFGIYVFHQWFIWNITHYEPMSGIINEHYVLFPILLFVVIFGVSLGLTHLALKTKIGKILLA